MINTCQTPCAVGDTIKMLMVRSYVYLPGPNVGAPANFDESRSFHPNCAAPLFLGIGNVKARNCRRMPRSPASILCTRNGALPVSSTICGRIRERVRCTLCPLCPLGHVLSSQSSFIL